MANDEMLTLVIQKFGFEHKNTIQFAEAMEWMGTYALKAFWCELMYGPFEDEDEDEELD